MKTLFLKLFQRCLFIHKQPEKLEFWQSMSPEFEPAKRRHCCPTSVSWAMQAGSKSGMSSAAKKPFFRLFVYTILVFILAGLTEGCDKKQESHGPYSIGRDSSWYPLQLGNQEEPLTAFSTAAVQEIAKTEQIPLQLYQITWGQLLDALDQGNVEAVFTTLQPNVITRNKYVFSKPLIYLGPVLIVRKDSKITQLADLNNKITAVYQFDDSVLLAQQYPKIIIQTYQNKPMALEDLANGKFDAVLMPILDAKALTPYVNGDRIKIVTGPLDNSGIRLITVKERNSSLIRLFNRGLQKIENSGRYNQLLDHYQLR